MHCEGTGLQKLQTPSSKALASAFSEPPRPSSELASVLLSLNCLAVNAWTHESWEEIVGGDGLSSLPSILSPFISVFSRAGAGDRGRGAFRPTQAPNQLANVPVINHSRFRLGFTLSPLTQEKVQEHLSSYCVAIFKRG